MIYVSDTTVPAVVAIPRTTSEPAPASVALSVVNTTDRHSYDVPVAEYNPGALYYYLRLDFRGVPAPGEYEYRLTGEGAEMAVGILRLGDVPAVEPVIYETIPQYEQYNAD